MYIFLGFITGISVGTVGIGAGSLLMPILIMMGVPIKTSVATAIQLIPQSFPGLWLYYKKGHFDMKISFWIIIGSLLGTTFGVYIVNYHIISEKYMYTHYDGYIYHFCWNEYIKIIHMKLAYII